MAQTETREFGHLIGEYVVSVQANGGTVEVQIEHAPGVWITSDTIAADGAFTVLFGGGTLRFVPSGGATYEVHA
ncbi:hypothetical protein [Roseovarius ramblicola]|uniref:Uncharacterized protein n=1 Tax=Roseovarius ramblicola TaxID=2022336 RepID=A0ABV5HYN3_9RHOB